MPKTFIIGSIFNVPLQMKTAFMGPLNLHKKHYFIRYSRNCHILIIQVLKLDEIMYTFSDSECILKSQVFYRFVLPQIFLIFFF